jgi:hypothetical protein
MTCEVAVLNRMAVALAADSAVTFTSFVGGEQQRTYASGANKIFQLSKSAPVGVMLFNNAALQELPWELIVKTFRAEAGTKRNDKLAEYATALEEFVRGHAALFPVAHREKHFRQQAARAFLKVLGKAQAVKPVLQRSAPFDELQAAMLEFMQAETALNAATPLSAHFTEANLADAKAGHSGWLAQQISDYLQTDPTNQHLAAVIQVDAFVDMVIESLYRFYQWHFNSDFSGIVVAGYGEKEYLPSFVEVRYYGFLLDCLIVDEVSRKAIDHDTDALIEAFAKKSMVETFLSGFAPEVWSTVTGLFRVHAGNLLSILNLTGDAATAAPAALAQAQAAFSQAWTTQAWQTHYAPLNAVISGLPPSEMAELAETLVMLESLKEKVTQRTQSVGGPVDVAVITRSEGLVWIKRKHYFSAELNPRYFDRQLNQA